MMYSSWNKMFEEKAFKHGFMARELPWEARRVWLKLLQLDPNGMGFYRISDERLSQELKLSIDSIMDWWDPLEEKNLVKRDHENELVTIFINKELWEEESRCIEQ